MKKVFVLSLFFALLVFGCARTWEYRAIDEFRPSSAVPPASVCQNCHQSQYASWKKNRHSSEEYMSRISVRELRECEACHTNTAAHAQNPGAAVPPKIAKLTKTQQNTTCGKCHYNQQLFGVYAINPHDKHALYKSVGFEGHEQQLSCLDCHSGHKGGTEMLMSIKAHACFKCHTGVVYYSMAIFQPFNYIFFGKACQACHAVHGESTTARWTRMGVGVCVVCHFAGVALVN